MIRKSSICISLALLFGAPITAQEINPGDAGWLARLVDATVPLNNHSQAEKLLNLPAAEMFDVAVPYVDFGGDAGTFHGTQPYPNGVADISMSDFVVVAWSKVTIPAGEWTVAFGSDDGGKIRIPGVTFLNRVNENRGEMSPPDDEIRFEGNRSFAWTLGAFELTEPLLTTIEASFHERDGGDAFEIAVTDFLAFEEDPVSADEWFLLGDPDSFAFDDSFDWAFRVPGSTAGLEGDLDGDGQVGFADFLILSDNFSRAADPPGCCGDIDRDGMVGFPDFLILSANFGKSAGAVAIPEPSSLALLCACGVLLRVRSRG